ncbi:MAG: hypothetical protein KBT09_02580 [Bacteroidales bacterium]|nr:hypothetical protein [Candidatus Sodaliphilus fimicaballi]
MDRRKFLAGAGLGVLAAASPISLSALENVTTPRPRKSGRLNLSFFP